MEDINKLTEPCPYCPGMQQSVDAVIAAIDKSHIRVTATVQSGRDWYEGRSIEPGTIKLNCRACDGKQVVLTPLGKHLVDLYKLASIPPLPDETV